MGEEVQRQESLLSTVGAGGVISAFLPVTGTGHVPLCPQQGSLCPISLFSWNCLGLFHKAPNIVQVFLEQGLVRKTQAFD